MHEKCFSFEAKKVCHVDKSGKSGFSAFNISKNDISNLDIIYGNAKLKNGENSKYLEIETKSM